MNKKKIINDPVHGFIKLPSDLIYEIIQHPFFQRLRRIRQLGLSEFVYPGAVHTRFHHALGAMHLMNMALDTLRSKGVEIDDQEYEATQIAILLHDLGHGPMSHALEQVILKGIKHEKLSYLLMMEINLHLGGTISLAIDIFMDRYPRKFFHQLVSSQLDMDRMDYLQRDSFFTGVTEGKIGSSRIIKMLSVYKDELVVEEKGIYSIENFLTARRLMYWQVYLHKTNLSTEQMLIQLIKRAKYLVRNDPGFQIPPPLDLLFKKDLSFEDFQKKSNYLYAFASLDDYDVWALIKQWPGHHDKVLSILSQRLLERKLFKVILSNEKEALKEVKPLKEEIAGLLNIEKRLCRHFVVKGTTSNEAYMAQGDTINILTKNGKVLDIAQASDLPNIKALRKIVKKYYLCWLDI
ncbi:MAG: HD domain-containing protein [Microscillaceae bacterium]|nr:HD domain-containing protein [Microscillaceae bacterium]